jgi:hypothetical protein
VAIDRSSSTHGGTLKKETAFIGEICELISPRNETPVQVLPWNDTIGSSINMSREPNKLSAITSLGGTDPRVLYTPGPYLETLKDSGIWFLLTDGQIHDRTVQDFALQTAAQGMHGTPCVIVVFGLTVWDRPASCDISVGVALYAVTPNCLFLFCDTESRTLYIIQCKGCFKGLLPDPEATYELNYYTQWSDLPTLSLETLRALPIPPPVRVSNNEVALQGQLKVDLEQLYQNAVPQQDLADIITNDDNLKSIVIAEMTRGRGDQLQGWLQKQYKEKPTLSTERPDIGGKAQKAITGLLHCIKRGENVEKTTRLRRDLRNAHEANWKKFESILSYYHDEEDEIDDYNSRVHWASSLSNTMSASASIRDQPSYSADAISSASTSHGHYPDSDEEMDASYSRVKKRFHGSKLSFGRKSSPPPPPSSRNKVTKINARVLDHTNSKQGTRELYFPGFQKSSDQNKPGFIGTCMLCESQTILALLLKTPPKISTPNFPLVGSQSALAFPLAMGNFAELDVISNYVCCESCALYLVRNTARLPNETIVDALPLVPIVDNEVAWLGVITAALRGRFRPDDLPSLFLAMLDRKATEDARQGADGDGKALLQDAMQWVRKDILHFTQIPNALSASFIHSGASDITITSFATILSDTANFNPENPADRDIFSLRYPLPGFAVIVRLLRDRGVLLAQRQLLTFHRLLYQLTEQYFRILEASDTQTATKLLNSVLFEESLEDTLKPGGMIQKVATNSVSLQDIATRMPDVLDDASIEIFRSLEGFEALEKSTGPATAIFLHHLAKFAPEYGSPIDIFNTIKALPSMKKVIFTPFLVDEDNVKEYVSQFNGEYELNS